MLKVFKTITDLDNFINLRIPGDFSGDDMLILADHVKKLKPTDSYLEIGVQYGKSAACAIFSAVEGVRIYLCDIEDSPRVLKFHNGLPRLSRQYYFESEELDTKSTFILGDSKEVAKTWDKEELSLIFIDGDHSYEEVKADIESWYPHLKKGGVMLFHDYGTGGVGIAVDELIKDSGRFKDFFIGMDKYNIYSSSIVGAIKI